MVLLSFEEAAKELASFGLTGNQARAYVALVQLRVAPVRKIAQLSKIRREEIYRLMPKLERLGLVEKILGKPTKYKPISLEEALSILIKYRQEETERKIAELAKKKVSLLKDLEPLKNKKAAAIEEEEGSRFILILDRDKSLRKLISVTDSAEKEIALTADGSDIQYAVSQGYEDALRSAVMRGVKVRILLKIDEVNEPLLYFAKEIEPFKDIIEVRHMDQSRLHIMVVDNKQTSIGTYLNPNTKEVINLWSNNPSFVSAMKYLFEKQWHESTDINSRIEHLQTGKPIERTEVLRGRGEIYEYLSAGQSKIKSNLFMMGDATLVKLFKRAFTSASLELKNKGARVRLLTNINKDNLEVAKELAEHFEVRHLDRINMRAVLGDEEIGFSWITTKPMPEEGIYSNNPGIVHMLWEMAEDAWDNAVDAQSRITELKTGKPIERTEVVRGRENILKAILAARFGTKSNVFAMGDGTALKHIIQDFMPPCLELKGSGVRIRLLTNINEDDLEVVEEIAKHFEVRHLDRVPMRAILGDREVGFSWISVEDLPYVGIHSNSPELVRLIWEIAENAWDTAVDAQLRIDEIRKKKPIGKVSEPIME